MAPQLKPYLETGRREAGCDEAGRGPLAGPVFAAAVILPPDFRHPLLNDSKQMTEKARDELRVVIEREAVAWAVEEVSAEEIDRLNILWASVTGMQRAVLRLNPAPDFLLIDGNKFRPFDRYGFKDYRTIVHGDALYAPIWPRPGGTSICGPWRPNIPSKAGNEIWAILPPNTSRPYAATASLPCTASPSTSRNSSRRSSEANGAGAKSAAMIPPPAGPWQKPRFSSGNVQQLISLECCSR